MALHGLEIQREFAAPDVPIIEHPAEARLSPAGCLDLEQRRLRYDAMWAEPYALFGAVFPG